MPFQIVQLVGTGVLQGPTGPIGATGTTGATGSPDTQRGVATINFGTIPTDEASVVVSGLADMTPSAHVNVFMVDDDTTADNTAGDHKTLNYFAKCSASDRVSGTGFTVNVRMSEGFAYGTFKVHYIYVT
jgi:hypothetical protein